MAQAKITDPLGYKCAPDGHTIVTYPLGVVVTGQVAVWALADHKAARMFDPRTETKVTGPTETKFRRKRKA